MAARDRLTSESNWQEYAGKPSAGGAGRYRAGAAAAREASQMGLKS